MSVRVRLVIPRAALNLVLAVGYMRQLLESVSVVKYLSRKHADLLAELERVVESTRLGEADVGSESRLPREASPSAST